MVGFRRDGHVCIRDLPNMYCPHPSGCSDVVCSYVMTNFCVTICPTYVIYVCCAVLVVLNNNRWLCVLIKVGR